MSVNLNGTRVAILVAEGFEQIELSEPRRALVAVGASADVVSPADGYAWSWDFNEWGGRVHIDVCLADADPADYDALLLPGGLLSIDTLRVDPRASAFVCAFFQTRKPVATLGHAPWLLVDAGVVRGRRLTSRPSLQNDLENAGAQWVDAPVVYSNRLLSGQWPSDLSAFEDMLIKVMSHARGTASRPDSNVIDAAPVFATRAPRAR